MRLKKKYMGQRALAAVLLSSMVVSSPVTDLHADEKDKDFSYYEAGYDIYDDEEEGVDEGDDDDYYAEENYSNPEFFDIFIEDDIPALTRTNIKRKGNLLYCIQADGTAEIVSYTSNAKSVKLPSKLEGKKVTKIGNGAFKDNTTIVKVKLPTTIKEIGDDAFASCTDLTTINIPGKVTKIGSRAFYNCSSLSNMTVPSSVKEIGASAFKNTLWICKKKDDSKNGLIIINNILVDGS